MLILMGAMGIAGILLAVIGASAFLISPLHLFMTTIRIRQIFYSLIIFVVGVLLTIPGVVHEKRVGAVDKNFAATTNDVFTALQNAKAVPLLSSAKSGGQIEQTDPTTLVMLPRSVATRRATKTSTSQNSYKLRINLHNSGIKIIGSFSADYKTWCFTASSGLRQEVYDQYGIVTSNLASHSGINTSSRGLCSNGRAYFQDSTPAP